MLRTTAATLTHLLAIIGAGFLLASGHAFVRTVWFEQPAVSVTRSVTRTVPVPIPVPMPDPVRPPAAVPTDSSVSDPSAALLAEPLAEPSAEPIAEPGPEAGPLDAAVKPGSITLREAYELFERGAFFLDARYEEDFDAGRIAGAFWMPASRVPTGEGRMDLEIIEPGGVVIIYCTGGDCDASENTAIRIEQFGYTFDIRILGKGYTDWVDAGLPVEGGRTGGDVGVNSGVDSGVDSGGEGQVIP